MTAPEPGGGIDGTFVPRRRDDLDAVTIGGDTVIHDRARLFHLDPVATVVWESCDGTVSVDALGSELAATFRVDPGTAGSDVLAAVRSLAADGLLAGVAGTAVEPAADAPRPSDDLEIRFDIGGLLLGVSANHAGTREAIRTILAAHATDTRGEPAASYALAFAPAAPDGTLRSPAHALYDQDGPVVESVDPNRVLRALLAALAAHGDLAAEGLGALPATVIGRDGLAVVVARTPELPLDRVALARHGLTVADGSVAFVDCSGGVVVGAPGLEVDLDALDRFAKTLPAEPDDAPPLGWGRRSVLALATDAPGDAAHALLRLGPIADDDTPAVSGADLALDALLGLLATVPIVAITDTAALAAVLREPVR